MRVSTAVALSLALWGLAGCDYLTSNDTRLARAETALSNGDARAAVADLRKVLQQEPDNTSARIALVRALLALGELADAQAEFSRAFPGKPADAQVALLSADLQLASGRFADLLQQLDRNELTIPEGSRALYRGRALLGLGQLDDAITAFQQALAAEPANLDAKVALGDAYAGRGDFENALRETSEILQSAPNNVDARFLRATIHLRRAQFREAEAELEQANSSPDAAKSLNRRARVLAVLVESRLGQGKLDAAGSALNDLSTIAPNSVATQLLGARIGLARGDYQDATANLQRLVSAAPDYVPARMLLGAAHLSQGHLQQGEAELAEVVQRAPDNVEARKLLARARLQMDRPDAALSVLTPALEDGEKDDADVFSLLSAIQTRMGGSAEGIKALEQSVTAAPDDERRKLDLAAGYVSVRRFDAAVKLLRPMKPLEQGARREALLVVAVAASQGQKAAQAELDRLLAENASSADLLYLAAAYYRSQREFDRSRSYIQRALSADPSDKRGLAAMAGLELARGDLTAADAALRKALAADPANEQMRVALADVAFRRNDREGGIAVLEEGRKAYPDAIGVRLALARALFGTNDAAGARKVLEEINSRKAGDASVASRVGQLLLEAGQFDEALGRFRDAVDADPQNADHVLSLARAQLALDQSAAASESVSRALALRPGWPAAVGIQALIDVRAGKGDQAVARVQDLRKKSPRDADLAMIEGDVRAARKQYAEAAAAYAEAGVLKPSSAVALRVFEARRLAGLPRPESALTAWLDQEPGDQAVRMMLAQQYIQTQKLADGARELEAVSKAEPNNPAVLNNLAWIYQELGDRRAVEVGKRAHELAPGNPAIADTYGWILFTASNSKAALPLLEAAARVASRDPEIQYHYAAALAAEGRKEEALETLRKAMAGGTQFRGRPDAEKLLANLDG